MIWAYVSKIVVTNDVAVFAAMVDYSPRLFAVKGLETPLDITNEVFWRWSKKSGADFSEVLRMASIYDFTLKAKDNGLYFEFGIWKNGDSVQTPVALDWSEIADIMSEVRLNGSAHKTSVYGKGYKYLAKEFRPEAKR